MRVVVARNAGPGPEDAERRERLVALLAAGLERLLAQSGREESPPHPLDYSESLSPTTSPQQGHPTGGTPS